MKRTFTKEEEVKEDDDHNRTTKWKSNGTLWRQDGWVDKLDKKVSKIIFSLELGLVFELVLLLPACSFGIPTSAFGVFPMVLMLLVGYPVTDSVQQQQQQQDSRLTTVKIHEYMGVSEFGVFACLAVSLALLWGVYFYYLLLTERFHEVFTSVRFSIIPSLIVPIVIGKHFAPHAYRVGCFYVTSWCLSQMFVALLKVGVARTRPLVTMLDELASVKRHHPQVQEVLTHGRSSKESFPSGDTAGAVVFSAQLYSMGYGYFALTFGAVVAFGRLYFHAHHALDVIVAAVIAWFVTMTLAENFGVNTLDEWDALKAVAAISVFYVGISLLLTGEFHGDLRKRKQLDKQTKRS